MNNITWNLLTAQTKDFSEKLCDSLKKLDIYEICLNLEIDHMCVRLGDGSQVETLKRELREVGQIISSVQVNGREISIIQLTEPLNLGHWKTYGVELPYPKQQHSYKDGWEHVEFVLAAPENSMDTLREFFFNTFTALNRTALEDQYEYSEDEPHADGDQLPNPTIGIKVNGIGIKFHVNPIQTVVGFKN